jgi:ribulose-phosphate 3-epimerase
MRYEDIKFAPSILASDFTKLGQEVIDAQAAGADWIHIDVMDGRFVPNITMGPLVVEAVQRVATIPLDVHLMIVEPEKYIQTFADAGADSISVHIEACPHLHRVLGQIRDAGCRAGVAINPHTPPQAIAEVLDMLDLINVMTVNPGFGGQKFIQRMTDKITTLRTMADNENLDIDIEVDGGINAQTIGTAMQAGANVMIVGSSIFRHPQGIQAGFDDLRNTLRNT